MSTGESRKFEQRVSECSFLWASQKDDYVLLRVGEFENELLPIHLPSGGEMLRIHDDALAEEVYKRMRAAGVPIVTEEELKRMLDSAG